MKIRHAINLILLMLMTNTVFASLKIGIHKQVCKPVSFSAVPVTNIPGCKDTAVPLNLCVGTCLSYDGYPDQKQHSSVCKCCQPVRWRERKITLQCNSSRDNSQHLAVHTINEAVACACAPCSKKI